jgi:hypothetical protein
MQDYIIIILLLLYAATGVAQVDTTVQIDMSENENRWTPEMELMVLLTQYQASFSLTDEQMADKLSAIVNEELDYVVSYDAAKIEKIKNGTLILVRPLSSHVINKLREEYDQLR